MTTITAATDPAIARRLAGAKGRQLHRLTNDGFPVPKWAVIGKDVFEQLSEELHLNAALQRLTERHGIDEARNVAREIEEAILTAEVSHEIRSAVEAAMGYVGDIPYAVRSSASEEDSERHSFAGLFKSFLNVRGVDATLDAVKRCWASAFATDVLQYRDHAGLRAAVPEIAVILQQLIDGQKSGVVFTVNPLSGRTDELVVSSVFGLGEGLVSGQIDADIVVVGRKRLKIQSTTIGAKENAVVCAGFSGCSTQALPPERQSALSLTAVEIKALCSLALKIEHRFGYPLDIEWTMKDGRLWILQARPVTGSGNQAVRRDVNIWDNANIIDNFPGITRPLTCTFVQSAYARIFSEYFRYLLIPPPQRRQLERCLSNLIGYFDGRLYYNLMHWYKIAGLVPFKKMNRRMMELSMGLDQPIDQRIFAARIEPFSTHTAIGKYAILAVTTARFAWLFLTFGRNVAAFRRYFMEVFKRYERIDFASMEGSEIYSMLTTLEQELLPRWARVIPDEVMVALPYGLLRRLIAAWLPSAPDWVYSQVIAGVPDSESLQSAKQLEKLRRIVSADADLEKMIKDTPAPQLYDAVRLLDKPRFLEELDRFFVDFSFRSLAELKLESPDLTQDPSVLFEMLKTALRVPDTAARPELGRDAAAELLSELPIHKRWILERLRNRVRRAIEQREVIRFCRARIFGIARRMMGALGHDLVAHGILEQPADIFFLKIDEVRGCYEATVSRAELKPLIRLRQQDEVVFAAMPDPPTRFVTRGPACSFETASSSRSDMGGAGSPDVAAGELRGVPCSTGIAEGEAQVVSRPDDFAGGILVAERTDPGWTPIFRAASAILIERGSPLSHSAIVARELGIPAVIKIHDLTARVSTGLRLRVNGYNGTIQIVG